MKVPVFTELQKIEFMVKPKPEVHGNEVLMKVECCGICGSDVHGYLNGIMVPVGTVMGHECSGLVEEVGEKAKNFKPEDRVVAKPIPQCVECYWCKKGQYSLCSKAFERAIGISPAHDGAFTEYVKIEYPDEMLFQLPPNVSFQQVPLLSPFPLLSTVSGCRHSDRETVS